MKSIIIMWSLIAFFIIVETVRGRKSAVEEKYASQIRTLSEEHAKKMDKVKAQYDADYIALDERYNSLQEQYNSLQEIVDVRLSLVKMAKSNLTAIPYMAGIIADYETYELEQLANRLNWGDDQQRLKKVRSLLELRKETQAKLEEHLAARYQLAYLLELYPALQDIIETDYKELPITKLELLNERDPARDLLSKEEYAKLSITQRNQLALDRYVVSHQKTKWQIGRDYELFIWLISTSDRHLHLQSKVYQQVFFP